jgi:PAS domain S-box-containing protein
MSSGRKNPDHDVPVRDILQDYELRFRMMADNVSMGIFQVTSGDDSRIISTNPALARMLGYSGPDELSGKPTKELLIQSAELDTIAEDIGWDHPVGGREIRLKHREGSEIWVSVQAWKLKAGKTPVIEGFIEDITENKVFEQEVRFHEAELHRYALELVQANKKLNILSTITRHDILNKLTGLNGYLELMKGECSDPGLQEYFAMQGSIIQTITRQIRFTKDYQDIGIETPRWFDVKDTIVRAVSSLPLHPVTLTIETGDLRIYADPMLEKVFYNLVENAIRHAGKLTRIRCTAEIDGEGARIIIEDDGNGVPERFKDAIFIRKHFKNTGFGLYLSREILGITGLSIKENGAPGKGARFEITIPRNNFRAGDAA